MEVARRRGRAPRRPPKRHRGGESTVHGHAPGGQCRIGYSHPRCYAAALNDCATKVSGEHAISASVLKVFAQADVIDIGGLAWMEDDDRRTLPVAALASNILCERHNTALSDLDDLGAAFVGHLIDTNAHLRLHKRRRPFPDGVFDGPLLERWLLKCLCGLVASRTADVLHPREEWRPPKLWLEILFARSSMPDRWGLYVVSRPGERTEVAPGFAFAALSDAQRSVYGLKASFIERRFVLAMAAPAERPLSPIDPDQFRSSGFVDTNTLNMIMTTLTWPAGQQGGTMTVLHDNPRGS